MPPAPTRLQVGQRTLDAHMVRWAGVAGHAQHLLAACHARRHACHRTQHTCRPSAGRRQSLVQALRCLARAACCHRLLPRRLHVTPRCSKEGVAGSSGAGRALRCGCCCCRGSLLLCWPPASCGRCCVLRSLRGGQLGSKQQVGVCCQARLQPHRSRLSQLALLRQLLLPLLRVLLLACTTRKRKVHRRLLSKHLPVVRCSARAQAGNHSEPMPAQHHTPSLPAAKSRHAVRAGA